MFVPPFASIVVRSAFGPLKFGKQLFETPVRWWGTPPMFSRVTWATVSKSTLATWSGHERRPMYSCAPVIRRFVGSFIVIEPELSIARTMSWSTWVTDARLKCGTNVNQICALPTPGLNVRVPVVGASRGDTPWVPRGNATVSPGELRSEPDGITGPCASPWIVWNAPIAPWVVMNSASFSWRGTISTIARLMNRRRTRRDSIVATVDATPLESRFRRRIRGAS